MKYRLSFLLVFLTSLANGQTYFPPSTGNQWDTLSPAALGWCTSERDTLMEYLDSRNSKSFIMLHKGRIVEEEYMNGFGQDSIWYWASAGKSLMAFLLGVAQEDGLLNINDKTSQYLGVGWTNAPQIKEDQINIWHQITMTTGLDYNVPNPDCLDDSCLIYLNDPGTHWYYHNAPYRLTQDVLEVATSQSLNLYTIQSLTNTTGMFGLWFNYIFFSRARDMARFGLLCLNEGIWGSTPVLGDTSYFKSMVTPSQSLNEAYGYLWWLNGSSTYKQPGLNFVFSGQIIPSAPSDLYMAAGKNDQRIYVVPSLDLVVVRQGDPAYGSLPALSGFDEELWILIMNYLCSQIELEEVAPTLTSVYPNPAEEYLNCPSCSNSGLYITGPNGMLKPVEILEGKIYVGDLRQGVYILCDPDKRSVIRFIKN